MVSRTAAIDLSQRIQALHDDLKSWRKVSALHFPDVAPGTLCRIAKQPGWLPKSRTILRALGLVEQRQKADEYTKQIRREINRMARETKRAVLVVEKTKL